MGLISLAADVIGAGYNGLRGAVQSGLWKEYFESGDMSEGILMKRGDRIVGDKSRNVKADENLISSGSGIDVQENQCMIIVENGRIVEFCCEPGRYTYDNSIAPSLLSGQNKGLKALGKEILSQWSTGGQRFSTQRVYFINLGELIYSPLKWGCGDIAFHHTQVYRATGAILELDMVLRANGECTIQITDPRKFFEQIGSQKVGSNGDGIIRVTDDGLQSNLKSGIVDHIATAISTLGTNEQIAYTAIKANTNKIKDYLNAEIERDWVGQRGFGIANITINGSPIPSDENKKQLEEMQASFNMAQNANAMNYDIQKTMARGIENAGNNGGGGSVFGLGMAMGGIGAGNFGNITNQNPQTPPANTAYAATTAPNPNSWQCSCGATATGNFCPNCGNKKPQPQSVDSWICPKCGSSATGKFCPECGTAKPASDAWTCSCGASNKGKFCQSCGAKKPESAPLYRCDKCGWEPEDPTNPPKFCPECGDVFDENDKQ